MSFAAVNVAIHPVRVGCCRYRAIDAWCWRAAYSAVLALVQVRGFGGIVESRGGRVSEIIVRIDGVGAVDVGELISGHEAP